MTIFQHLMIKAREYALEHHLSVEDFGVSASMIYAIVHGDNKRTIGVTLIPHGEGDLCALEGKCIEEIFDHALTFNPLKRAFALALINAIGQHALHNTFSPADNTRSLLVQQILEMTHVGDEIVFVGNLAPVVAKLKEEGRNPIVFCRQKNNESERIYSDIFEYETIQTAPIAIITGATLIGSTLDALLKLSPPQSIRILAGFSAGAHPSWFKGSGLTHVTSMLLEPSFKEALRINQWNDVFNAPGYFCPVLG